MTTSDRNSHLATNLVTGPGVGHQLARPVLNPELAEQLADRLDREHGIGTHRVNGRLSRIARSRRCVVKTLSKEWIALAGEYESAVNAVRCADYDSTVSRDEYAELVDARERAFAVLSAVDAGQES